MELDVNIASIALGPLECGPSEAALSVEAIRSSTVGKEHHDLVNPLRILREKVLPMGVRSIADIERQEITQHDPSS